MSAPPPDHPSQTPPPQQQPSSAIRLVPYSESHPRPWDSSEDDTQHQGAAQGDHPDLGLDDKGRSAESSGDAASVRPSLGTVSSSHSSSTAPWILPKRDRGLSVSTNAPSRGRLSASSYTTHTSQSSRFSASSQISDAEPSSSTGPSPTPGKRRPTSRRRNFVAVLNEDKKTFSLVPQRPRPEAELQQESQPQQSQPSRSESALSDYGGPSAGLKTPQLPSFPATPRVSQSSSHEGYTSYASSQYDRPSSSFTSTGTIPDRSITPNTPVPSSPGSSTVQENFADESAEFPSSPLNYRRKGAIRKLPDLTDYKGKQPSHSPTSDTTEIPLPAVPEAASPLESSPQDSEDNWKAYSTEEEKGSIHSGAPSNDSENTNYIVHQSGSGAPSEAYSPVYVEEEEEGVLDDSVLDPEEIRPQASFISQQTESTDFDTTNIQIYGHSGSEASEEALPPPAVGGAPYETGSSLYVPALQPQPSLLSIQSAASTSSEATNYKIYGHSSPALPPVPETEALQDTRELRPAESFLSVGSTGSEAPNYQIYGRSSPAALESVDSFNPPSPSGSYSPLIITPTAPFPLYAQEDEAGPSGTANTEPNYVVHGDDSPSFNESPDPSPPGTALRPPRRDFSEESLVVPPLRPKKQRSQEGFGYYRSRSRSAGSMDNLSSKKSGKSLNSISSIINEEAVENFYAGQAFLNAPAGQFEPISQFDPLSIPGPSDRQRQLDEQRRREQHLREASLWTEGTEGQPHVMLPVTPHQWSSQLSTVMSETEPGSSHGGSSRQASLASVSLPGSAGRPGSNGRRGSRCWSSHSRQMLSISSSLAGDLEGLSHSRSNSDPIERPSPSVPPRGFAVTVRDHDEHGDGLADLQQITPRPSRQVLNEMYANSNNSSERNLHSSQSTRSRASSFGANTIPAWARVYYGSGERKFLRSTSISSMSEIGSSRPISTQHSGSPSVDFPSSIYSPRRRPREGEPSSAAAPQRQSIAASMDMENSPGHHEIGVRRSIRRMTSSLWSPHLRRDVRARDRYSIWDPPSVAWSAESGMFGRRNLQVVLFVMGFVFPFAWMVGAALPLPKPSPLAMIERYSSISDLGIRSQEHEFERHIESIDELRYQNARWWRTLNRGMSVIGLLIIGVVIALAVASVKQGWS
ncbi:hypothetical protein VM1G_00721 [Cytospora mali]|uniref:Serine-rich protein n=1 Tax=Cytospora mali TaxID=578113 RepID=A0A194VML6_CYTMA|nr:hypothetical protein VM1G_00721 [Valsa mali]